MADAQKPIAHFDIDVYKITDYQSMISVRVGGDEYQKMVFGQISKEEAKQHWMDDFNSFHLAKK